MSRVLLNKVLLNKGDAIDFGPPPSGPDRRIFRIRLARRWFYLRED
jgi:hypothetical protein